MNLKTIFIAALLGAALSFGVSYYFYGRHIPAMQARLDQTPPVVIVDFARLVSSYPLDASQQELEKMMHKANSAIVKLKDAGYVVLDAGNIIGAPDDLYLPEDVYMPDGVPSR